MKGGGKIFIEGITIILLLVVIGLIGYLFYLYIQNQDITHKTNKTSNCRCMRQIDANNGFCGMCDKDGVRYGCNLGNDGCNRNCKKVHYSGNRCDSCRDNNCTQWSWPEIKNII